MVLKIVGNPKIKDLITLNEKATCNACIIKSIKNKHKKPPKNITEKFKY